MEKGERIPDGFLIETDQLKNLKKGDFVVLIENQKNEPWYYKSKRDLLESETFKLSTLLGVPEWFKPYYEKEF